MARWINKANDFLKLRIGESEVLNRTKKQFQDKQGLLSKAVQTGLGVKQAFNWPDVVQPHEPEVFGYIRVLDSPLSSLELFKEGSVHQCRLQFSNLTAKDDLTADIRIARLKFSDTDESKAFNMVLLTGEVLPCFDPKSLEKFVWAFNKGGKELEDWCNKKPINYYSLCAGLCKAPECFTSIMYTNLVPYIYSKGGVKYVIRFRLVPAASSSEQDSGRLTDEEQNAPWNRDFAPSDKSQFYLRTEIEGRLLKGPVEMRIQAQICPMTPGGVDLNPCVEWEAPWEEIAIVDLATLLPKRPKAECSGYDPFSTGPFNEAAWRTHNVSCLVSGILKSHQRPNGPNSEDKPKMTYSIAIETENVLFAGTNADIYIYLTGVTGRTDTGKLGTKIFNDFERGKICTYKLKSADIGDVRFATVYLCSKLPLSGWNLRHVTVTNITTGKSWGIPVYRWIPNRIALPIGRASLPHKEDDVHLRHLRRMALLEEQREIRWKWIPGLPGFIDCKTYKDLPSNLQFNTEQLVDIGFSAIDAAVKTLLPQIHLKLTGLNHVDKFETLLKCIPENTVRKHVTDHWKTDIEFGRQYLNGLNPVLIRRCSAPLPNLPVTTEMVSQQLDRGRSLDEEMQDGHVYYVDHVELLDIPRGDKKYVPDPIALFYVRSSGEIVPIAIQLRYKPGPDNPIWTPNDTELDWLFAKMWLNVASSTRHQLVTHLFRAHLITEMFCIATYRQLSVNHPLYKLLIPHLRFTVAINTNAREILVGGPNTIIYQLFGLSGNEFQYIGQFYKNFDIKLLNFPEELKARGVDDTKALPNYFYRDDGLKVWSAMAAYVHSMVSLYYANPEDIEADEELQAWISDIRENGFKSFQGDCDHGVPEIIRSQSDLEDFITMVIFNASCYHASINFCQLDFYAFAPNSPIVMRQPPPTRRGETTMESIMKSLPNLTSQTKNLSVVKILSTYSTTERYLGDFPDRHFLEDDPREIMAQFRVELKKISENIKERNTGLACPYEYMLPEKVPNYIGI